MLRSSCSNPQTVKVVNSVETAHRMIVKTPAVLARYVGHTAAYAVCSSLRAVGADVFLQSSHVTCPHCRLGVPCDGAADPSRRGVTFSCPACHGLTLLDSRDRKFHPLLRCDNCHSLLNLPPDPRTGKYRCRCGEILSYQQVQDKVEFVGDDGEHAGPPPVVRKPQRQMFL